MKLLLVSVKSQVTRGGIAVWTDRFLQACDERQVEYLLVNTELVGKRAIKLSKKRNIWDEMVRTNRILRDLKRQLKEAPQVAHLNTSCGTFGLFRDYIVAARIRKAGVPLITHYHCDIGYWVKNRISRFFLGKLAGCSQENLVLNESSRMFLKKQYGLGSTRLPNFLEDDRIGQAKERVSETIQKAVYVGRVSEAKGSRELYDTARRCPQIRFMLIGELSSEAKQWEVPENVELLGGMPNEKVVQHLKDGDVFFFPTRRYSCAKFATPSCGASATVLSNSFRASSMRPAR